MKLRNGLALLLAMVLLCGCAGAEGISSGQTYSPGLALAAGEVYCLGENVGLGFIPIWRVGMEGMEKVRSRIGGWSGLYAVDDGLMTIEPVLNIGEILGSIPTSTCQVNHFDPVTGKTRELTTRVRNEESGVCEAFAAQGKAYRDVHAGNDHMLQRLDDGEWVTVAQWTGDHVWMYESFCIIGSRHEDKPEYVALYEFTTGKVYDVTAFVRKHSLTTSAWEAVLEDGVLYLLQDGAMMTVELSTGREEKLGDLPKGVSRFILTDTQMILMSNEKKMAWVLDRSSWKVVSQVNMTVFPQTVLLHEGRLYVHCLLTEAKMEIIDLTTGESAKYSLE